MLKSNYHLINFHIREYNKLKGTRMEKSMKDISIEVCGFYLPPEAYYDKINDAPDDANKATLVKKAMEAISRILLKEVKSEHIGVCNVYPGGVDTNFRAVANHNYLKPETVAKMIKACIENEDGCVHDIVIRPFIEDNMA